METAVGTLCWPARARLRRLRAQRVARHLRAASFGACPLACPARCRSDACVGPDAKVHEALNDTRRGWISATMWKCDLESARVRDPLAELCVAFGPFSDAALGEAAVAGACHREDARPGRPARRPACRPDRPI